ncbi:uncharacterized protein ARMOST_08495 [Armillaria ostoyae]|uniref:Uncharacterized protein n=1 Tax=Armillaria ostoyae TaxID=47428 RepID=A0A284R8V2_ARMOS|nr:uncharacterized protein ARMOST_08495 [Armillaria ostoyae]
MPSKQRTAVQVLTKQRRRQGGAGRHRDLATSPSQRKLMASEERTKVVGFVAAFFIQTPMPRHAAYMQHEMCRKIPTMHSNIVTSIF